jgi:hypothetical protein
MIDFVFNKDLGGMEFYPLKPWVRNVLAMFPVSKQIEYYALLLEGADLSFIAPDELGCAESCTRMLNSLFPGSVKIKTGTSDMYAELITSDRWERIDEPEDGCVIMAVTGQGTGHGHVGIVVGTSVFSNNSKTGKWARHLSVLFFQDLYQKRGFVIHYFRLKY